MGHTLIAVGLGIFAVLLLISIAYNSKKVVSKQSEIDESESIDRGLTKVDFSVESGFKFGFGFGAGLMLSVFLVSVFIFITFSALIGELFNSVL